MTEKPLKLKDIAARIADHLQRFEQDPIINSYNDGRETTPYYHTYAWAAGPKVGIRYISYQRVEYKLSKVEALTYLDWLDAGYFGKHFEALKQVEAAQTAGK